MHSAPMSFVVVSTRVLVRELVSNYCEDRGFRIGGSFNFLSDLNGIPDCSIIILHISSDSIIDVREIENFRASYPNSRIIVLCSKLMHDQVSAVLSSCVEAIIVDDSSLRALSGVLTVVQEGFRLALSPGRMPAPELGDSSGGQPTYLGFRDRPPVHAASGTKAESALSRGQNRDTVPDAPDRSDDGSLLKKINKLSLREQAVIQKLSEGASNKDIAKELHIGESTVKVHLRSCYRKIGARNRTQAAIWFSRQMS